MKIYHEQDNGVHEIIEACDKVLSVIPGEYNDLMKQMIEIVKNAHEQRAFYFQESEKYKLMWDLRSLENEINQENGIIIMAANGDLEIKEFSFELILRIKQCLNNRSV